MKSHGTETQCRVSRTHLQSVEEVRVRVGPLLGSADGWVQYAGSCVVSRQGQALDKAPEGYPLAAEFSTGATTSVSLRQSGDGWDWVELTEEAGGAACRALEVEWVSTEPGLALRYRVLWARDESAVPVRPWRPWTARFTGWKAGEKP